MKLHHSRASRLLAGLGAALAALTLGPALTAPASARPDNVDPATLTRGEDPSIPYLVRHTLHDGDRRIRVAPAPNHIQLLETRDGYVVVDNFPRRGRFRITAISPSGERDVLARPRFVFNTAVSPRGTRVAWANQTGNLGVRSVATVVNPHTGRVLAKRVFHNADVLAVTHHRVLLSRSIEGDPTTTVWWNYKRDKVRRVSGKQGLRADVRQDVVVLANRIPSACTRVAQLSEPSQRRYKSCWVTPHAWSPNGRWALATHIYFDQAGTDRWLVTNGRNGRRVARVHGRLDWDVAWEDNRHFLTLAQGDRGATAIIRCDVTGACERASRTWHRDIDPDAYYVNPPVLLADN